MKKRILAMLLAFVMLVGMLPIQVFAAGSLGQVRVIVENTTYTTDEGAPWDGTLVDTKIDLTEDMTMMTAILTALNNAGHTWNYSSGDWETTYIGSIEKDGGAELAEFTGGSSSGWKGTLNDWFVNMGFNEWKASEGELVNGDVIRVMYTMDMGADLGGGWGTNVGNLSSLTVSAGTLSPAFDKETLDYTLTVDSDVNSLNITAVAENKEDKVTVTVGGTEYRRGIGVPVADGTVITVTCGEKSYTVTVSVAKKECEHQWVDATCSAPKTCSVCGETDGEADPDAHKYVDGKCEYCAEAEFETYTVTLPTETVGYTAAAIEGSVSPVTEGGSYSFTVTIADGYEAGESFAVKANDVALTAADGVYTIENITADQTVTVEGVTEKVAEEAVPFEKAISVPSNGNSSWGYVSKLTLSGTDGSVYEAYWSSASNPFVVDVILGQDTDKDATITAAFSAAGLRAPSITGETTVTLQDGKGTINVTAKSAIAAFYPDTSWTINLTVDDGSAANRASYTVTLPDGGESFTVAPSGGSASPVIEGRSYSFTVNIPNTYKAGENFAVKSNDVTLEAVNGVYTIGNIQADQVVTVEGVEKKTLAELNVTVIAPAGSTVSSGRHYSYFKYDFSEPLEETTLEDGRIQKVFPTQSGRQGFVRVQHPEGVTYWDFDGLTAGSVFEITEEMLFIGSTEFTKETVYANFEKNVKDKADLYLTANEKGWLDLNTGDTWNLNVFRNFLSLGNTISNDCLALPDVEYKVISVDGAPSDVVSVTPNENNSSYAEIKAEKPGTAIILVSYDAVYNCDGEGGKQWSALWPENTGVIVVTVDGGDASITTNMTVNEEANSGGKQVIDAEHDILFYVGNSGASYSFKPEDGCTVTVNHSSVGSTMTFGGFTASGVETAEDGTVTVNGLTTGTHIVKVEKDGKAVYQVIRARQVSVELLDADGNTVNAENPADPGQTVTVQFHDLVSPLEKLSGVYNANFGFYYNGEHGTQVRSSGGTYGAYTFSGDETKQKFTVTIPVSWNESTYTLTDGSIKLGGFGGSFGSHRTTTYIAGKEVNTNASGTGGVAAVLPDIVIATKPCGYNSYFATLPTGEGYTVNGLSGEANPIREGETYTFTVDVLGGYDSENMVVKVNGQTVTATDGTYVVESVTEDLNITVEGIVKIEADMSATTTLYTNGVDGTGWGRTTYAYVDTVSIGGAAVESYAWDGDTCNVILTSDTPKNAAVGFVWAVGGSNENWYDKMSATLNGTAMTAGEPVAIKLQDGQATVELYASYNNNSRYGGTKTFVLTGAQAEPHTHTPGEAVVENEIPATCTADGSHDSVVYCTACGEELSRTATAVPASGHSYENGTCTVCGEADPDYKAPVALEDIYTTTGDYLSGQPAPGVAATDGEWRVIGLARASRTVPDSYYETVTAYVQDNIDENGRLHSVKSTENSRIIVALTAIGKDVTDVGGYDLLSGLDEMSYITAQGINGPIWALIAFDTHDYEIPAGDVTRESLVQTVLDGQLAGGGWALNGSVGDPDMTGMALQALAPYYGENEAVTTAVDKALTWLSGIQNKDGTFSGSEGTTSESLSQVITGLTALGINPETDSRFVKNDTSVLDALCAFYVEGGGFKHVLTGERNTMATEQAYYALVSYYRFLQNKTSLYDMSDVTIQTGAKDQAAADAVAALIDAIGTVTKDSDEAIDTARKAYDALTDAQKELVGNYETLTAAEATYAELIKTAADEAAAKAVEDKINAIGTVALNSEDAIAEARTAYEKLTSVQKALVSNLDKLEAAEEALTGLKDEAAADEVEKLIDAIGAVTKDSAEKIAAARKAYDALTDAQKKLVENYKVLTDAESKLSELNATASVSFTLLGCSKHGEDKVHTLAGGNLSTWIAKKTYMVAPGATVKDVLDKALAAAGMSCSNPTGNYVESINGMGEFTNGSNSGWMYTLNGTHPGLGVAEQKVKEGDVIVFHYTDDYTKEEGSQGYDERDQAVAEKVQKLIDAIGTVTLDSAGEIAAARKAYDALSYTQKQMVSNYDSLTAAEAKFAQLKKANDEKKAQAVENLIDKINSDSATFEEDVKAAKAAYDALTSDQKKLVANYQTLADALKELANEEDKEAAKEVEKLIAVIGTVTADSEEAIKAAREAYDKLTHEQKALVGNLAVLEAAEEAFAAFDALGNAQDIYKTTGDYLEALGTPVPGAVGGEWMVIGLLCSDRAVPDAYYDNVIAFVRENIDENERLHNAKSTENARMILALTALGKDVTDVDGHNLLLGLNDMDYVQKQGINGPIWALIAFDSGDYPTPEGNVTREALLQTILDAQLADGGWALSGSVADPDMTGMALQALAPYYETNADVKAAVDTALDTLSQMQAEDSTFASIDGVNSESIAQVITALAALGIDAHTDARFVKNGVSVLDALCAFFVEGGGFMHIPGGDLDGMSTEQSYYALTAYFRMLEGKTNLYDMTDVLDMGGDPVEEEPTETMPVETKPEETESVIVENEDKGSFPWWLVIVIAVLAGAIVVLLILAKPKKGRHEK